MVPNLSHKTRLGGPEKNANTVKLGDFPGCLLLPDSSLSSCFRSPSLTLSSHQSKPKRSLSFLGKAARQPSQKDRDFSSNCLSVRSIDSLLRLLFDIKTKKIIQNATSTIINS